MGDRDPSKVEQPRASKKASKQESSKQKQPAQEGGSVDFGRIDVERIALVAFAVTIASGVGAPLLYMNHAHFESAAMRDIRSLEQHFKAIKSDQSEVPTIQANLDVMLTDAVKAGKTISKNGHSLDESRDRASTLFNQSLDLGEKLANLTAETNSGIQNLVKGALAEPNLQALWKKKDELSTRAALAEPNHVAKLRQEVSNVDAKLSQMLMKLQAAERYAAHQREERAAGLEEELRMMDHTNSSTWSSSFSQMHRAREHLPAVSGPQSPRTAKLTEHVPVAFH